jgi:hypothetical protein
MQIDSAALELELVDLAFAVVLAASLEGQDLQVARQVLELGQQFSYRRPTQRSEFCAAREMALRVSPVGSRAARNRQWVGLR